ncbi:MAG: DNA repair protein RecO [Flavobacteriaceae bacterium]|nr:DNA repair protein RecO [Flavobacteriaceae bacterium]
MLVSTKAIVISKLRYKDYDLIVKCYTQKFGVISYLLKNVIKTKKGKFKLAYFQLLTLLEIQADHKDSRSLQYLKDLKLQHNYSTLHTNIKKSAIVIFLSEILTNILKEEEQNLVLYNFLETSLIWFDENETNTNFHLLFLIELTKYLGFYPDNTLNNAKVFNLQEGRFQHTHTNKYCVSGENLRVLKQLLGINFDVDKILDINTNQKREFLDMILLYFKLHLDGFKTPKSLTVLNQVFS